MQKTIKAILLSALVLPGLGQLYKGDKVKGAIFITLVNIFLLLALFLALKGMGSFLLTARISGPEEAQKVLNTIKQNYPQANWLLAGFIILWFAAVVDAAFSKPNNPKDVSSR